MSTHRFNMIVTMVLAITFIVFNLTNGQSDRYQYDQKRHETAASRYCGANLSDALHLVCKGIYNSMFKKNGREMDLDDYSYGYDYPLRTRASANAMMGRFGGGRFRRESRGIHDECCVKGCSISELTSYCGR